MGGAICLSTENGRRALGSRVNWSAGWNIRYDGLGAEEKRRNMTHESLRKGREGLTFFLCGSSMFFPHVREEAATECRFRELRKGDVQFLGMGF